MTILCMTGWQQPHDALINIAPGAMHFDYAAYDTIEAVFKALPPEPSLAIGWSLGGQIVVRAIAAGHLRPGALLLLGCPFQWKADAKFSYGVAENVALEVKENYRSDPAAMLKGFNALIALGDAQEKHIITTLNKNLYVWNTGSFWLEELANTSCAAIDFSGFPPTEIIHGLNDKVIHPANAEAYADHLLEVELQLWPDCAHAPHLHDPKKLQDYIKSYV